MTFRSFQVIQIKGNSGNIHSEDQFDTDPLYVIHALDEVGNAYQSQVMSEYELLEIGKEDSKLELSHIKHFKIV